MIKSIVLLSGGLDSLVSLGLVKNEYNVALALTFDYGQKSAKEEIEASAAICKYYNIQHKVIKLDWLKDITNTALVSEQAVPTGKKLEDGEMSAKSVWVPNRNGLFLNIAGSFADAQEYTHIILGANKEEAVTFPDNTAEFANRVTLEFEYSTRVQPKVLVPLINFNKNDIVKKALENNIPLELVRSCYKGGEKHCGECESCMRLKRALEYNKDTYFIKLLF